MIRLLQQIQPDEIYNLGAQSHVKVSFELPEYTGMVDGLGALSLLEAIRITGLTNKAKFYQASSSEMFGKVQEIPQKETTPFLSSLSLWSCKIVCLLDHQELSRSIWNVCGKRHLIQS